MCSIFKTLQSIDPFCEECCSPPPKTHFGSVFRRQNTNKISGFKIGSLKIVMDDRLGFIDNIIGKIDSRQQNSVSKPCTLKLFIYLVMEK
jgi:hypothetical protein